MREWKQEVKTFFSKSLVMKKGRVIGIKVVLHQDERDFSMFIC